MRIKKFSKEKKVSKNLSYKNRIKIFLLGATKNIRTFFLTVENFWIEKNQDCINRVKLQY